MGRPLHWIVILQPVSYTFAYRYDPWYRADTQRPVDAITDVVNDLGVKILQQYAAHGNVAFSPTGVAFVLAALYEGSAGRGSQQIADAVGLPANRDVTRIGFRDIHRRLRSYLNADGFLGGLTLSMENTRLRPEYEDILRFYGFDLSSIEQEANVTVSAEGSPGTTELPASTASLTTLPMGTINVGNATTTAIGAITTLPSAIAETTIVPSDAAAGVTQQTVAIPTAAGVQPTVLIPMSAGPGAVTGNIPQQPAGSLTTITSSESVQPPLSAGAESVAGSLNAVTAATGTGLAAAPMDGQTSPSTVTMIVVAGDQNTQSPTVIAGPVSGNGIANVQPNAGNANVPAIPNTGGQIPMGVGATMAVATNNGTTMTVATNNGATMAVATNNGATMAVATNNGATMAVATNNGATMPMGADTVPGTSGMNTEVPMVTNVMNASPMNAPSANTEVSVDASTVTINMMPANMSAVNATINTANAPAPPMAVDTAGVTTPSPVAETAMDNSIISQPNTEGMGLTTMIDVTTAPMGNAGGTVAPIGGPGAATMPPVQAANGTSNDLAGNPNNSTLMDNQAAGSLVDENAISMNRRKKSAESEAIGAGLNLPEDTVKDESTNNRPVNSRRRRARSPRGYFSSYPDEGIWMQDLDIWKSHSTISPSESSVGDATSEISFLVNGCDVSSVSASTYVAVLPFAYFPSLHAVALEFPLDDPRYNIILLMPTDRTDTHRLARDLSGKSLRSLRKRLQPTWVRATIPSFMLRGFVTLTSSLQRLGILDVFEPRVADLSPMTADLGVYARDVQQSIGVNIRNYMKPDRTHSRESSNVESPSIVQPRRDYYRYLPPGNGLFERAGPVPFTALHPFLYFIVDTETSVSLIAGRVDDPLNSRIL